MSKRVIIGRTVDTVRLDTNVFNPISEVSVVPLTAGFSTQSTKVAGVVKISNMFIKLLFTQKGSSYINKLEGTYFSRIFDTNVRDGDAVLSKIQDAMDDAADQIMAMQSLRGAPSEEKLTSAEISSFEVVDGRNVAVEIKLSVAAGEQAVVQLPSITLE